VTRLRELEDQWIIERRPRAGSSDQGYWLTAAGESFDRRSQAGSGSTRSSAVISRSCHRHPSSAGSAVVALTRPARTRLAFITRRFVRSVRRAGPGRANSGGRRGRRNGRSFSGPFRSCVQRNAGLSSGPHKALDPGLGIGPRFGSQIKMRQDAGFRPILFPIFHRLPLLEAPKTQRRRS
jgi:hypothetical protein